MSPCQRLQIPKPALPRPPGIRRHDGSESTYLTLMHLDQKKKKKHRESERKNASQIFPPRLRFLRTCQSSRASVLSKRPCPMLPNCEEEKEKKRGTPARHVGDAELAVEERERRKEVGTRRGRGDPPRCKMPIWGQTDQTMPCIQ